MKLADWLYKYSFTPEQLRRMLNVKQRSTIHRYLTGQRIPARKILNQITELTEGAVTEADFADPRAAKCAVVIQTPDGKSRQVFPWSRGRQHQEAAFQRTWDPEPGPDAPSNTVSEALVVLGVRARLTAKGVFLLDGRPTDARRVVEAANRVLEAQGKSQLSYPSTKTGLR